MRYRPSHKPATRARILEAAAHELLSNGLAAASVAKIMRRAGLTHGGFYAYFASKEALVEEVIGAVFEDRTARLTADLDHLEGEDWLVQASGRYVNRGHRDNPAEGCAIPALGGEVARAGARVRQSFERGFETLASELADRVPQGGAASPGEAGMDARERALALIALWAGGVMLARAVADEELSRDILRASRRFALAGDGR